MTTTCSPASCSRPATRRPSIPKPTDDYRVGEIIELVFHPLVLPKCHYGIAGKDAGQTGHGITAEHEESHHRPHHEDLLALVQVGQIAQRRDQVECVPRSPERLFRQRISGGVQRDKPDRAHGERHEQQADNMQHATPPLLHVKPADPGLDYAVDRHLSLTVTAIGIQGLRLRGPSTPVHAPATTLCDGGDPKESCPRRRQWARYIAARA